MQQRLLLVCGAYVADACALWECGRLTQIAYAQSVPIDDGAAVVALHAGKDVEQGTLARAVLGDEADALSLCHTKRDVLEEHVLAEGFCQMVDLQVGGGHFSS